VPSPEAIAVGQLASQDALDEMQEIVRQIDFQQPVRIFDENHNDVSGGIDVLYDWARSPPSGDAEPASRARPDPSAKA
jgi:hypothetical protein